MWSRTCRVEFICDGREVLVDPDQRRKEVCGETLSNDLKGMYLRESNRIVYISPGMDSDLSLIYRSLPVR